MAAVVLARLALVDEAAFPRDANAALRFGSERMSRASGIHED